MTVCGLAALTARHYLYLQVTAPAAAGILTSDCSRPKSSSHAGGVTVSAMAAWGSWVRASAAAQQPGHRAGHFWLVKMTNGIYRLISMCFLLVQVHTTPVCCNKQQACASGSQAAAGAAVGRRILQH